MIPEYYKILLMSLCLLFLILLTAVCFSTIFLIEKQPQEKAPTIHEKNELDANSSQDSGLESLTDQLESNKSQDRFIKTVKIGRKNLIIKTEKSSQSKSRASIS